MEMGFSNGKMEVNTMDNIKRVKNMEKEYTKKPMEMFLKGFLRMMYFKEMVFIYIIMEIHMKDIIKMDIEKVKVFLNGQMEINTMENGKGVKWTVKER
jgi:hypothetical protein